MATADSCCLASGNKAHLVATAVEIPRDSMKHIALVVW